MDVQSAVNKVTVIGNGALSLSVAAQIARCGTHMTYVDLKRDSAVVSNNVTLTVTGAENYQTELSGVASDFESVSDSDIVIVAATASSYERVFSEIIPRVRSGQTIVFFPACFGALRFISVLGDLKKDITICEAVSYLYVCEQRAENEIFVQSVKQSMKMAVSPASKTCDSIDMLNQYFKSLTPARNFLETSMDNMNMTLHPLPLLLNAGVAEHDPSAFHHYTEGVSPAIGHLMERIDSERMQIGRALELELTSAYSQLVEYYGNRGLGTLGEYVSSPLGPYPNVKGFGLTSRYITEDIPYLLVPAVSIAQLCNVKTPVMDICIQLASALMQTDYWETGYKISSLPVV